MNTLSINFKSVACNGYPTIKILLDGVQLVDHEFTQELETITITVPTNPGRHELVIDRYGKTDSNLDQTLSIDSVTIDNVPVPDFILNQQTKFCFNQETHVGSRFFGPNGLWYFTFQTPIITYILDQKIIHEAQYNQDYEYPWSYKLGPTSVNKTLAQIDRVQSLVDKKL